jgi:hypothetical protein
MEPGSRCFSSVPVRLLFYRAKKRTVEPPAVFPQRQIFLNQALRQHVHRHKPDFVALPLDPEMHYALTALHVADAH